MISGTKGSRSTSSKGHQKWHNVYIPTICVWFHFAAGEYYKKHFDPCAVTKDTATAGDASIRCGRAHLSLYLLTSLEYSDAAVPADVVQIFPLLDLPTQILASTAADAYDAAHVLGRTRIQEP